MLNGTPSLVVLSVYTHILLLGVDCGLLLLMVDSSES